MSLSYNPPVHNFLNYWISWAVIDKISWNDNIEINLREFVVRFDVLALLDPHPARQNAS